MCVFDTRRNRGRDKSVQIETGRKIRSLYQRIDEVKRVFSTSYDRTACEEIAISTRFLFIIVFRFFCFFFLVDGREKNVRIQDAARFAVDVSMAKRKPENVHLYLRDRCVSTRNVSTRSVSKRSVSARSVS